MNPGLRDPVLLLLTSGALLAEAFGACLAKAPNRLVSGVPLRLWQAGAHPAVLLLACAGAALLLLAVLQAGRIAQLAILALALGSLIVLILAAGQSAAALMAGAPRATRVSLGSGFWAAALCLATIALQALQRLALGNLARLAVIAAGVAAIAALIIAGQLDALSLSREYAAHQQEFWAQLARHCGLVAVAVTVAVAIGAPLGLFVARRPSAGPGIFGALNLLQTIPSIALFGLLIAPLSALGLGGIGVAPAIIALVLYSLLPVARNTEAGISGVDRAVIDAARGMGFTGAQILWRIELPLGLPVFVAGLRIVTVQAIGLAAVAALIGAGGLGSFIFQGIGQYATDLVLLGAIPTILLALAADLMLALVAGTLQGKHAS